jgi:hypothetical protein
MKNRYITKNSKISPFVYIFIVLFFITLSIIYAFPNYYEVSVIVLAGYALIIVVFFLVVCNPDNNDKLIFQKKKILDENSIKNIVILLMIFTFIIPPISFSEVIIDWNQISFLNFFRSIIFLIGCAFLPGACIYNLLFSEKTLPELFNVEPFLVKITIYPIISFIFLGISTLILDFFGLIRNLFAVILFLLILMLFFLDLVKKRLNDGKIMTKIRTSEIQISMNTARLLLIMLGIILIALGTLFSTPYLIAGDRWRGIEAANNVGRTEYGPFVDSNNYPKFWGVISFSLSVLSGIPYININCLLFLFVYLFATSIYLLMKAILSEFDSKYALLATILVLIFSELVYTLDFGKEVYRYGSFFMYTCMIQFSYHSFAFFSVFTAMALFIGVIKNPKRGEKSIFTRENIMILFLVSIFLLTSLIIYFLPLIAGFSLILIYCLFYNNKERNLKLFLLFWFFFVILYIFLDILTSFFFSWIVSGTISSYFGITLYPQMYPYLTRRSINGFIIFILLIISFLFFFIIYIYSSIISSVFRKYSKSENIKLKIASGQIKRRSFFIFLIVLIFFSISLVFGIKNVFSIHSSQDLMNYYLSLVFLNIGFIGILGVYLSYYCYKKDKKTFYIMFTWSCIMFGLASLLIFKEWIFNYPNNNIQEIQSEDFFLLNIWFSRVWYYSIIPLSLFSAVGIIYLKRYFKSKNFIEKSNKLLKQYSSLSLASFFIVLTLSNSILVSMYWNNYNFFPDEDAHIIGWVTENIPTRDTNFIVDSSNLQFRLGNDLLLYNTFYIWEVTNQANLSYELTDKDLEKWLILRNDGGSATTLLTEDSRDNVIQLADYNHVGNVVIEKIFNETQTSGNISFWIKKDTITEGETRMTIFDDNGEILISWQNGSHYYFDIEGIQNTENVYLLNDWYHNMISFNCTNSSWTWTINGILQNNTNGDYSFKFNGNPIAFSHISFSTDIDDHSYNTFIDSINFSWDPINAGDNLHDFVFDEALMILNYFISQEMYYVIITGFFYNRYQDLLERFYETIYKYGQKTIYFHRE